MRARSSWYATGHFSGPATVKRKRILLLLTAYLFDLWPCNTARVIWRHPTCNVIFGDFLFYFRSQRSFAESPLHPPSPERASDLQRPASTNLDTPVHLLLRWYVWGCERSPCIPIPQSFFFFLLTWPCIQIVCPITDLCLFVYLFISIECFLSTASTSIILSIGSLTTLGHGAPQSDPWRLLAPPPHLCHPLPNSSAWQNSKQFATVNLKETDKSALRHPTVPWFLFPFPLTLSR